MVPSAIKELLERYPFHPFHVRSPDGERILIPSRDHASLVSSGRRFIVFSDDDRMRILDPILISELELAVPQP